MTIDRFENERQNENNCGTNSTSFVSDLTDHIAWKYNFLKGACFAIFLILSFLHILYTQ